MFGKMHLRSAALKSIAVVCITVESLEALAESRLNSTSYRRWRSTTATLIRKGGIPSFQISYTTQPASMHRMPQTTNFRRLSLTLTRYLTLWSVSWIQTKSTTECPWLVGRYFAITSVVVLLSAINTRLLWHGLERHALCSFVGGKRFGWKY